LSITDFTVFESVMGTALNPASATRASIRIGGFLRRFWFVLEGDTQNRNYNDDLVLSVIAC
jgi:hypothetical protein